MGEEDFICQSLGVPRGSLPFTYLGVPLATKRLNATQCKFIVEKFTSELSHWTSKLLSYSGRLRLLQTVIEGMYEFLAQIFDLPKKLLKMVESKCRFFLWAGSTLE